MSISRRSTLAYAPALTAFAAVPGMAAVPASIRSSTHQLIQHPLLHADETGSATLFVALALPAPDTVWVTSGNLTPSELPAAMRDHEARGYGLRRLNAFQTRRGMRYAAIWEWRGAMPARAAHDLTREAFEAQVAGAARDGLSLAHVDAVATDAGPRFAAIWTRGGDRKVFAALTGAAFAHTAATLRAGGHRLHQVAGYTEDGAPRFAAVFELASGPRQEFDHAVPADAFAARSRALKDRGYRLRDASGYVAGGQPLYTAMWEKV